MSQADIQFTGGNNIALKIPKYKYEETVRFYRDVLKLPYLGFRDDAHSFRLGPNTLWLDCKDSYPQNDVWLEVQTNNPGLAGEYLREQGVDRRDEVEIYENSKGFWISDPCGTILRVNPEP